jgi:hypothetical protein
VFSIEGSAQSVASPLTPDLLKHFAFEAESVGDFDLAERYYKEVSWCMSIMQRPKGGFIVATWL